MRKRKILFLSAMMVMTMAITQFAYASQSIWYNSSYNANTNSNAQQAQNMVQQKRQLKIIEKYTDFSKSTIKINNQKFTSDYTPVIKDGTTLIPVRTITEALGADVYWYDPYAVIIAEDGETAIIFDMENGLAYISDDPDDDLGDLEDSDDPVEDIEDFIEDEDPEDMDVSAGLIDNTTYAPLRFVAEGFGLEVGYDSNTCQIDIRNSNYSTDDEPWLKKDEIVLYEPDDVEISIVLNDYELEEISYDDDELDEDDDYEIESTWKIIILEDFIDTLDEVDNEFELVFENDDDDEVTLTLNVELKYLDEEPELSPDSIEFDEGDFDVDDDYMNGSGDLVVEIDLNGWTFVEIDDLSTSYYDVNSAGNKVTIDEDYLDDLDEDDYQLEFVFEAGDNEVSVYLEIEVND